MIVNDSPSKSAFLSKGKINFKVIAIIIGITVVFQIINEFIIPEDLGFLDPIEISTEPGASCSAHPITPPAPSTPTRSSSGWAGSAASAVSSWSPTRSIANLHMTAWGTAPP